MTAGEVLSCFVLVLAGSRPRLYFQAPPAAEVRTPDLDRAMKFESLAALRRARRELGLGGRWLWQKIATADAAAIARAARMLVRAS